MHKKLTFLFISVIAVVLIIEIISRIFFSTFSKSFYPFYYGFNKNILIFVEDLSQLNFSVQNTNVKKINKINKIDNRSNKSIWVFGGSTSDDDCYNGSWPDELQNLLPEYEIINSLPQEYFEKIEKIVIEYHFADSKPELSSNLFQKLCDMGFKISSKPHYNDMGFLIAIK